MSSTIRIALTDYTARIDAHSHLEAIEAAALAGIEIRKYADPTEGERHGLTVAEADAVAHEDASLIYLVLENEEDEEDEEPETYAEAADLFESEFGRRPDAEDGDQLMLWSHVCAARSVSDTDTDTE